MQRLEIIKITDSTYYKAQNFINELISKGNKILSIDPVTTNEVRSGLGTSTVELQILVFILFEEGDDNDKEKESNSV